MANSLTICICVIVVVVIVILVYNLGKNSGNQASSYRPIHGPMGSGKEKLNNRKIILKKDRSCPPGGCTPRQHPVLAYQRAASRDTHPASYGDPIRPSGIAASPAPGNYSYSRNNTRGNAYHPGEGPYPGIPMNVPVPQGSLKLSNEATGYPFHYQNKPLHPYDYFKPYGPNQPEMQNEIVYADTPFYKKNEGYTGGGRYTEGVPFVSSVSSYLPFPEVRSSFEKTGILQTVDPNDTTIVNLYRAPIAPLQELFKYTVQDKNGFVVPLNINYLEDGDIVDSIPGREKLGKWRVNIYNNNKFVWA